MPHNASEIAGLTEAIQALIPVQGTSAPHTHAETDVTNLTTDLSGKAASTHVHDYALVDHTHAGGSGQPLGYVILANDTLAQALATNINTQITVTANRTLTTTVPAAGIRCSVVVVTSGTTSRTITFGTGFKPVGTLATGTTTNRAFVIDFISNGTNLRETGRTTAMAV